MFHQLAHVPLVCGLQPHDPLRRKGRRQVPDLRFLQTYHVV
ncbi:MAG TPA: hypothetical protein VMG35_18520 [Bryobacteraceae bacterium]|nr:hypothetical protein [Bryobacteraceae bacterium]